MVEMKMLRFSLGGQLDRVNEPVRGRAQVKSDKKS